MFTAASTTAAVESSPHRCTAAANDHADASSFFFCSSLSFEIPAVIIPAAFVASSALDMST